MSAPFRPVAVGGALEATLDTRADGVRVLRSTEPLNWFPDRVSDVLSKWADEVPERTCIAQRSQRGFHGQTQLGTARVLGKFCCTQTHNGGATGNIHIVHRNVSACCS